jgi:dihydrofolate reductase
MSNVVAGITTSIDGYITGPNDGPGRGLGDGGEALHSWVFGGPWTYADGPWGDPIGEDKVWLDENMSRLGAVVAGRWTYEAADHWGGSNPWPVPFYIVTHRPEEQPEDGDFTFVGSIDEALRLAKDAAGDRDVHLMGGAEMIREALAAGQVDELSLIVAPIVLGGGKRLFDGFEDRIVLEHLGVRQSPFATFIDYRVTPS